MAELLLELFSEEIPARMQGRAGADLKKMLGEALSRAGVEAAGIETWAGPRRLTAVVRDLPAAPPDVSEERKGPRVGAPDKAVEGFLRGAGLESLDQCQTREDKKGEYYVAAVEKPGRTLPDVIAEAVPDICRAFPWPKSMRWGDRTERWVRPLRRILCLFDGEVVPFEFAGVESGDETQGHRVHGPGPFRVTGFEDYRRTLESDGHVLLAFEDRRDRIARRLAELCAEAGLDWVEDPALLAENAGIAEWPNPILGRFDAHFLELPDEAIRLTMGKNQKYFAVSDPKTGKLAPHFIAVADLEPSDGGGASVKGYERVLTARLEDARFFWDEDRKRSLESRVGDLASVVFHRKLGSVKDKAMRVAALARELAPAVGADPELAYKAGLLSKADLTTHMVVEFTDLQGVMGRYYAQADGEPQAVADAIRDHYKPQGPSDEVPAEPVSVAVALADKLDTLVGFWAIDEKPTGSKDPYALRRAALGIIRLVLENEVRLELSLAGYHGMRVYEDILDADERQSGRNSFSDEEYDNYLNSPENKALAAIIDEIAVRDGISKGDDFNGKLFVDQWLPDLLAFFADRLKVALKEQGVRHDLIDAVFALGEDDLVAVVKRVRALQAFLKTGDGETLLAGYTRAVNILKAEEKKGALEIGAVNPGKFQEAEEKALYEALQTARPKAEAAVEREDFEGAMAAIAPLRERIDAFFDQVTVNAEDKGLRQNRLSLLAQIRESLRAVADFDRIEAKA